MTTILTTTSKGQLTLKRDLLQHLGVNPCERLEFEKLPNGEVRIRAARPDGSIEAVFGLLQAAAAERVLREASYIAIPLPCLCEVVWVLRRFYHFDRTTTAKAIQALINSRNVITNRVAAEAGIALLIAGGDFADGSQPRPSPRPCQSKHSSPCRRGASISSCRMGALPAAQWMGCLSL